MAQVAPFKEFWDLVDKRGPDDCWAWLGPQGSGYGKFRTRDGRHLDARYIAAGSDRFDLLAWHSCDNKLCCNPEHISVGTREERAEARGRSRQKEGRSRQKKLKQSPDSLRDNNKPLPTLTLEEIELFWSRIDIRGVDDCWLWNWSRGIKGYGTFKGFKATRIALFLATGCDPGHLLACHSCDNAPCTNPAHLWPGTDGDNGRDRQLKQRGWGCSVYDPGDWVPPGQATILTPSQVLEIRELAASGTWYASDLARQYGVSETAVKSILTRRTWDHFPDMAEGIRTAMQSYRDAEAVKSRDKFSQKPCTKGCDHPNTDFTEAQVLMIRDCVAMGPRGTMAKVARDLGVDPRTINRIVKRITWKHI